MFCLSKLNPTVFRHNTCNTQASKTLSIFPTTSCLITSKNVFSFHWPSVSSLFQHVPHYQSTSQSAFHSLQTHIALHETQVFLVSSPKQEEMFVQAQMFFTNDVPPLVSSISRQGATSTHFFHVWFFFL